ncbi:hypothetical protein HHI36_011506 [Cryptolaemus montrouzieri]|uniref:Uncharacterized protein n=1 Tax=Cryptolaemus montrouzieri TaxID=559131 RepID=A0ABD2MLX2_9CUCU
MINCLGADANNSSTQITVLDSILMVNDAGFIERHDGLPIQILEHQFVEEDDVPLSLWSRNLNSDSSAAPEILEDYADIDCALLTFEQLTDENIVQNINAKEQIESDEEEEVEEEPVPTAEDALKVAKLLRQQYSK